MPRKKPDAPFLDRMIAWAMSAPISEIQSTFGIAEKIVVARKAMGLQEPPLSVPRQRRAAGLPQVGAPLPAAPKPPVRPPMLGDAADLAAARDRANVAAGISPGKPTRVRAPRPPVAGDAPAAGPLPSQLPGE